jgi:hypothetical protein
VVTARAIVAGASVPADDPKTGDFYWHLASVTMATDGADNVPVITVDQHRWGPIEELQRYFREFHIQPSGAYRAVVYNGTLFGQLPTGFSVDNNPFFELTGLASGDKIYAAITWDRRVLANGNIVGTITSRTIAKAAAVPSNNELTATRYYLLATVTLGAGNIPVIAQSRWGPIDDLPGTASNPYLMPPSPGTQTTAQTDYWNLTETGKGKDTGAANLAPTYDSVQLNKTGFVRFVTDDGDLKAFVRPATINSIGQITLAGPEDLAVDFPSLTLEFGTLGYTGGTPGGTITGTWNDGFTLDLLLPYTVFGTPVTLSPGSSVSVSGQGITGDPLIFSIPRGDVGETGPTGPTGATGATGPTGPAGGPLSMHTIGGSNFDGTQDVTSFPVPGPIGGTTPDTIAGTTGTFDSTLTVGAHSSAGTINVKNSSGTTTASIDGSDGSAQFGYNGGNIGLMIDQSGNITTNNNADATLHAFIAEDSVSAANGAVTLGANTGTDAWIHSDGTASFASGGLEIDQYGNITTNNNASADLYDLTASNTINSAEGGTLGSAGVSFKSLRHGTTGAMVAGVVTVTDGACTANTRYFFTVHTIGTVANPSTYRVTTRTTNTSFVVTASDLTDTSTLDWFAIEP